MRGLEQIPWFYDAFMALAELFGLGRWRRLLVAGAAGRTLEVGCGTGRNLPLYPSATRLVALDLHPEVMAAAGRRVPPGVPRIVARLEALPFRPASFDTVVSSLVFCSVDDPRRGLGEVRRVLRPTGRLRMMEHVAARGGLHRRLQDWLQPAWTRITGGCRPNRDTEAEVEAAGLRIDPHSRREKGTMRLFTARP